jgi:hypothetical protein
MKILVIGAKGHKKAHCVDWMEPFPNIEEYDSVVIDLQSLGQEAFDKIYAKIQFEMKKEIMTLFDTGREAFCIINRQMIPSRLPGQVVSPVPYPPTNYAWLPTIVTVNEEKRGTSITIIEKRFEKYLAKVEEWGFILDLYEERPIEKAIKVAATEFYGLLGTMVKTLSFRFLPIAENKSRKNIAGTLMYQGTRKGGAIHLLPPTTKCNGYEAVEILLDLICGQPMRTYPSWREQIDVPGMKDILVQIRDKLDETKKIQESIEPLQRRIDELDAYRDLLSASGKDLEVAVQRALSDIGLPTAGTQEGFPADLISKRVAVEVTGIKRSVSVDSEKVNQIARFKGAFRKKEKIVLVANTYIDMKPSDRRGRIDFTREVKEYLQATRVCCMTSQTLFELWNDMKNNKRKAKDIRKVILERNGELTLRDF